MFILLINEASLRLNYLNNFKQAPDRLFNYKNFIR